MTRNKFHVLLVLAALSIIVGGMACGDTQEELDKIDETYGVTG
jgi:rRNA pseudouridine-1189 N-methylase Emg1 (Nep1/Mra1 family)